MKGKSKHKPYIGYYKGYRIKSYAFPAQVLFPVPKPFDLFANKRHFDPVFHGWEPHGFDRTGMRYGRSVVVEWLAHCKSHDSMWWGLLCDCGTKFAVLTRRLPPDTDITCGRRIQVAKPVAPMNYRGIGITKEPP